MIIPIFYPSAAEFWMNSRNNSLISQLTEKNRERITIPESFVFNPKPEMVQWIAERYGLSFPVQLMAPSSEKRRKNKYYSCKVGMHGLPEKSFICAAKAANKPSVLPTFTERSPDSDTVFHICISTPEACFLQAASELPFLHLVKLGYDLCARYVCVQEQPYMQVNRKPLTSVASIRGYLERAGGCKGVKRAKQAIQYVLDNSNSPMETKLCMIMVLPLSMGGYGLKKPELNQGITLKKEAAALLGREVIHVDMKWALERVAVEYDSNYAHLSAEQHSRDKSRITALSMSGYTIISITVESLKSEHIDETFLALQKALGQKIRKKTLEKYKMIRQQTITEILRL